MTEPGDSPQRWRRYAAEIASIVVGILLALAADAGRQYLADRATERGILAALRAEFEADVREIGSDQRERARKLAAIDHFSRVRAGVAGSPPVDSLATAMELLMDFRFYTASHPVLDDILSTGQLGLIRSNELRQALMKFGQERARIAVIEEQERQFVARQMEPYLAARLDLEALFASHSTGQFAAAARAIPELLADRTFGSLLHLDRQRTEASTDFAAILLTTVSAVQAVLEAQR